MEYIKHQKYLKKIIDQFKANGIRTSIFVDPEIPMVQGAFDTGTDRIELYTESYAKTITLINLKQSLHT